MITDSVEIDRTPQDVFAYLDELDRLEGHGFGKLLAPLAKRQAKKQIAQGHQQLKQRLEHEQKGSDQ